MKNLIYPSYITFTNTFNPANGKLSVSFWVNISSAGRQAFVINDAGGSPSLIVGEDGSGFAQIQRIGSGGTRARAGKIGSGVTTNSLHHIVITDNYTTSTVSSDINVYIDGVLCDTYYGNNAKPTENMSGSFVIGNTSFNGIIGEIAIYNRVLSAEEALSLSKGFSPLFYSNGLKFYAPLVQTSKDLMSGKSGTDSVNIYNSADINIIYPNQKMSNLQSKYTNIQSLINSYFTVTNDLKTNKVTLNATINSSTSVSASLGIVNKMYATIPSSFSVVGALFQAITQLRESKQFLDERNANPSAYANTRTDRFYAPQAVFVEGYDPGLINSVASYTWDFGDGSPTKTGFNCAHVYETPGTYTITQTVLLKSGASTSTTKLVISDTSTSNSVTVLAPTGTTYYVDDALGNDTYNGKAQTYDGVNGPWKTATPAFVNMGPHGSSSFGSYYAGDKILFKRGGTYPINQQISFSHYQANFGYSFGAYGTGDKPIIKWAGSSGGMNVLIAALGVGPFYISFSDLEFDLTNTANGSSIGFYFSDNMIQNILLNRLNIKNTQGNTAIVVEGVTNQQTYGTDWNASGFFIIDCNLYNSYISTFAMCARFAAMNNYYDLAGNHHNYLDMIQRGVITDNIYTRPAFGRTGIRIAGSAQYTKNVYVANNYIGGWVDPINGYPTAGYNDPTSANYDPDHAHNGGGNTYNYSVNYLSPQAPGSQQISDIIYENNITTNFEMASTFGAITGNFIVRNNKFISPSETAGSATPTSGSLCPMVIGWTYDEIPVNGLVLDSNEFNISRYGSNYGAAIRISANQPHRNITISNNIIKVQKPNIGLLSLESETDVSLINSLKLENNTLYSDSSAFIVTSGVDLNAGTYYNDSSFNTKYPNILSGTSYLSRDKTPLPGYACSRYAVKGTSISIDFEQAVDYSTFGLKQVKLWVRVGKTGSWTYSGVSINNPSYDSIKKYYGTFNYNPGSSGEYYFATQVVDNLNVSSATPTLPTSRTYFTSFSSSMGATINSSFSITNNITVTDLMRATPASRFNTSAALKIGFNPTKTIPSQFNVTNNLSVINKLYTTSSPVFNVANNLKITNYLNTVINSTTSVTSNLLPSFKTRINSSFIVSSTLNKTHSARTNISSVFSATNSIKKTNNLYASPNSVFNVTAGLKNSQKLAAAVNLTKTLVNNLLVGKIMRTSVASRFNTTNNLYVSDLAMNSVISNTFNISNNILVKKNLQAAVSSLFSLASSSDPNVIANLYGNINSSHSISNTLNKTNVLHSTSDSYFTVINQQANQKIVDLDPIINTFYAVSANLKVTDLMRSTISSTFDTTAGVIVDNSLNTIISSVFNMSDEAGIDVFSNYDNVYMNSFFTVASSLDYLPAQQYPNSTLYVPELDYFFTIYWNNSNTKTLFRYPKSELAFDESNVPTGSFLQLLFSDASFGSDPFIYTFKEVNYTTFSPKVRSRLKLSFKNKVCFVSDATSGSNIFTLSDYGIQALTQLQNFRNGDPIDLSNIPYPSGNNLTDLIYLYLSVMGNNDLNKLNNLQLMSNFNVPIEMMYETYVMNEIHKKLSDFQYNM